MVQFAGLLRNAVHISTVTGKGPIRQLAEAVQLRLGRGRVGLSEYFEYGAYNPGLSDIQRGQFVGWRSGRMLDRKLNHDCSRELANDKLLTYIILDHMRFPIPRTIATYNREGRRIGDEILFSTKQQVADYMCQLKAPIFVKPVAAGYGRGALGISRYDADRAQLVLLDERRITIEQFLSDFDFPHYRGKLFQECLEPHHDVLSVTGTAATSCARVICVVTPTGPLVHTAFWKIATGKNMTDNFVRGRHGNCLGWIDVESGIVTHAICRMVFAPIAALERLVVRSIRRQDAGYVRIPTSRLGKGLRLGSHSLPRHFFLRGLRLQNWDIAFCRQGPVLVELNTESGFGAPQALCRRGIMDDRLAKALSWAFLASISRRTT